MTRPEAVVVVAASSGGLVPLRRIAAKLPLDFPAAVVIANHTERSRKSMLPVILSADGPLPALEARDGQPLKAGWILIAPGDRHLRLTPGGIVRLTEDPKDALVYPSADVLFKSAAQAFGRRAVGIVLSGSGSDGAQGLAAIRATGGIAVVQAPEDAQYSSMPRSALGRVTPDACIATEHIAQVVDQLLRARIAEDRGRNPHGREGRKKRSRRAVSLRGLRVLVAEDRYPLGAAIVRMLDTLGCRPVGPIPDIASGLGLVHAHGDALDCAVLDVDLRGEKVYPLAAALRVRGVTILFATGHGDGPLSHRWSACPRIEKPFDARALGVALRRALESPSQVSETPARRGRAFERTAERLKQLRNLLMASQAWMRRHANLVDRRVAEKVSASERSLRASRNAVDASRRMLAETHAAVSDSKALRQVAVRILRASTQPGEG